MKNQIFRLRENSHCAKVKTFNFSTVRLYFLLSVSKTFERGTSLNYCIKQSQTELFLLFYMIFARVSIHNNMKN